MKIVFPVEETVLAVRSTVAGAGNVRPDHICAKSSRKNPSLHSGQSLVAGSSLTGLVL